MEPWLLQLCRRTCTRTVITCAVVAAVSLLILSSQHRYLRNFFAGPYAMGEAELAAIPDIDEAPHYFAQIQGSKALSTGIEKVTIRKKHGQEVGRTVLTYYGLRVGNRFLIVEGAAEMPTLVKGELETFPDDLAQKIFGREGMADLRDRFYPFYLTTDSFTSRGYVGLIALGLLWGFMLLLGIPAWRILRDPNRHPLVQRVEKWGPLNVQSEAIQAELTHESRLTVGDWTATPNYLIRTSFFSVDVYRFQDLLWAYKKITKHSVNFVPAGKSFELLLFFYGGQVEISGTMSALDSLLQYASQRTPWAAFGYTEQIENLFKNQTRQFSSFVEERRQKMQSGSGAGG